jgi:hypothetical protein
MLEKAEGGLRERKIGGGMRGVMQGAEGRGSES